MLGIERCKQKRSTICGLVMRRAALLLTVVALLVSLPPLVVAKTERSQIYKRGLQLEAVTTSLSRALTSAIPRGATQPVLISIPAAARHTFLNEFYGVGAVPKVPASAATPSPLRQNTAQTE